MYAYTQFGIMKPANDAGGGRRNGIAPRASGVTDHSVLQFRANDLVFEAGSARQTFVVDSGAICLYRDVAENKREVIGFAAPGDIVGLGSLERHLWNAQALGETQVRPGPDLATAADTIDDRTRQQLARSIEQELLILRGQLVEAGREQALVRLAAFLIVLSRTNAVEGRDPSVIVDDLACGFVAESLSLDMDELQALLLELKGRGLVAVDASGRLQLLDIDALDRLADSV